MALGYRAPVTDPTPANAANIPADATDRAPAQPGTASAAPAGIRGRAGGRRRWIGLAVAGAVVILVAAGVVYAVTRPVEPGFDSPEAISVLLAERGAPCTDFEGDGEGHAQERGTCYADGKKIIIATFASRAEVEAHWERQLSAAADSEPVGMVIGDTWTISGTSKAYLRHAATVLGAEFRSN